MNLNAWFYGVPSTWRSGHETMRLAPLDRPAALSPWHKVSPHHPRISETRVLADAGVSRHGADQPEGSVILVWRAGWSLAFLWDRSGDGRGNCLAAFVVDALLQADEVRKVIGDLYPALLARIEAHLGREIVCAQLIIADPLPTEAAPIPEERLVRTEDTIAKRKRAAAAVVPPGVAKEGE